MQRTSYLNNSYQIELLALEAFKSSGFLIVNKTLIKHLGLLPAILLSNYIDKYIYFKEKYENNEGWFYLTHEQQMEQLNIKEYPLIKCKNILKDKGILEIQRRGIPAKEWIHINFSKLIDCLQLSSRGLVTDRSRGLVTELSGGLLRRPNIRSPKEDISLHDKNPSKKERSLSYLPIAEYLSKIIKSKKNITHTTKQIQAWAYDVCQLVEDNKVAVERINEGLEWYEKNIGGQYVPVIESGASLKDKFFKLEAAMERSRNSPDKKKSILDGNIRYYLCDDGRYRHPTSGDIYVP